MSLRPPVDLPNLDGDLTREPEDVRQDLAEAFSRDLFMFNRGVLGYKDLTEDCHGPLCTWHDQNPSRFKLTLIPRGHLKTSCLTIGKTMQRVVRNPENRILLANEVSKNSERFLQAIKAHADTNKRFRTLYSHLIPDESKRRTSWSQTELTFNRKGIYTVPTIDTVGMTGAMTSRHYTHLMIDDPISLEAAQSKIVMMDVITRLSTLLSLMDRPGEDSFDLIGTRWAYFDVYTHFMQWFGEKMAKYIRAAVEDNIPIWPERFSLETLATIRDDPAVGEYMFSCNYMNSPRDSGVQDFNVQDLKFWRWSTDEESVILYARTGEVEEVVDIADLDIITTVDVRYGEQKLTGDRDAVVTTGTTNSGNAIVLSTWANRKTPLDLVDHLLWTVRRFNPRVIGIQKAGYEMSLKYHLQAALEREMLYANVVPVRPGGPGKPHIRGLQPVAATGHLYILPTQHVLRNELAEYPLGQHDDVADALALQQQLWRGLLSAERMERYRKSERQLLAQIEGRGSKAAIEDMTPSELEDIGYDPEDGRYGDFHDVSMN